METDAIDSQVVTNLLEMIESVLVHSVRECGPSARHTHESIPVLSGYHDFGVGGNSSPHVDGTFSCGLLPTPILAVRAQNVESRKSFPVPHWELQAPHNTMTLPDISKLLEQEKYGRILCVKKIHKLGFRSSRYLRPYFAQYGAIDKLILLPSRQKESSPIIGFGSPVRPASMCFIVMSTEESARQALLQEMHYVGECPIEVAAYTPTCFNHGGIMNSEYRTRSSSLSSFETDVSC